MAAQVSPCFICGGPSQARVDVTIREGGEDPQHDYYKTFRKTFRYCRLHPLEDIHAAISRDFEAKHGPINVVGTKDLGDVPARAN
ncbi:MAG: hypothetical protein KGJ86_17360 [Chloroflexota bacterium]|nr:hypothetical protein [Chloroflexota bacterium]